MKFYKRLFPLVIGASFCILPACLDNETDLSNYTEWKALNQKYIDSIATLTEDGRLAYSEITPAWDNSFSVWLKWHNNREENKSYITPLSTSTCHVKYTLTSIKGDTLDSSSSYTCIPNNMVTGFMAALCEMRVNDTITAVIPYTAGYGAYGSSAILPYSTLIFGIRLDSISKLM